MQDARVDGGGAQVVGGSDGMDITGQMEVEVLHRNHLAVATPGRAALDAEGGALAGLADASEHALAQVRSQGLAQPDGRGGLAFAQRCGGDGGDVDVAPIGLLAQPLQDRQAHLGLGGAVVLQFVFPQSKLPGHQIDGLQKGGLRDVEIGGHGTLPLQHRGGEGLRGRVHAVSRKASIQR